MDRNYIFLIFKGNEHGRAFRDVELEQEILQLTYKTGIGAQFGGKDALNLKKNIPWNKTKL